MIDPLSLATMAIAALSPLLAKGGEEFIKGAGKDLWNLIKNRLSSNTDKKVLTALESNPENKSVQNEAILALATEIKNNPSFANELESLLNKMKPQKENTMTITGNGSIGIQDVSGSQININRERHG